MFCRSWTRANRASTTMSVQPLCNHLILRPDKHIDREVSIADNTLQTTKGFFEHANELPKVDDEPLSRAKSMTFYFQRILHQ